MKKVSDSDILFDLEYRGTDDFLSEMEFEGLVVPVCFVKRIKRIVKKHYDIDLIEIGKPFAKEKGSFCLMEFNDKKIVLKKGGEWWKQQILEK